MRAVVTENYGAAPTMAEVQTPTPGPGEVRVKIRSSSLNGFDTALARGYLKNMMEHRFPVVLGRDFAGTVDQVGEGVTEFAPGDDVFGVVLTQPLNAGGFGEYVVVPEGHNIAPIPAGLDHATAGVLGLAGAAAVGSLDAVSVRDGETVLVSGATGGVGAIVLQLANARGATVIATATPGAETDHVRELGAAHVVDRTQDLAAQVHQIAPNGVDVVLHFAGDPFVLADLLADGGRFASLLGVGSDQLANRAISATAVYASPHRALLEILAGEVAAGRLRIPVQRSYTLGQVPQAFADFAAGTLGKLAVTID
jgi:NADPH:quinone reductase-like Zn-dependent oxidoreductase